MKNGSPPSLWIYFSYDELFEEHQNETRPCTFFEHSTCVASIRNKKGFQIGLIRQSEQSLRTSRIWPIRFQLENLI